MFKNWTSLKSGKSQIQLSRPTVYPIIYIGCMTGTSVDQYADFIAVIFDKKTTLPTHYKAVQIALPKALRNKLLMLSKTKNSKITQDQRKAAEQTLTDFLISAYIQVIKKLKLEVLPKSQIILSPHGQTINHQPLAKPPICDVLLNPQLLANKTGYQVIAKHRECALTVSMAAPLAPVLIKHLFCDADQNTLLLNGGGIANICLLPANINNKNLSKNLSKNLNKNLIAYDTGPANGPLDSIVQYVLNTDPTIIPKELFENIKKHGFDYNGLWTSQGASQELLLDQLMQHKYFSRDHSQKSADRADFDLEWILDANEKYNYSWPDILATVSKLIINTIAQAILDSLSFLLASPAHSKKANANNTRMIAYGGLIHNKFMMCKLEKKLNLTFVSMESLGYDSDTFEALLMAYLGFCVNNQVSIDLSYCKRTGVADSDAKAIPGKAFNSLNYSN